MASELTSRGASTTDPDARSDEELDHAVRQIVSRAVAPGGVLEIFAAAGLKKPDVSVLSEDFLRRCAACAGGISPSSCWRSC